MHLLLLLFVDITLTRVGNNVVVVNENDVVNEVTAARNSVNIMINFSRDDDTTIIFESTKKAGSFSFSSPHCSNWNDTRV